MTNEKVKRMLDACYQAKRIRELLPPLPQGVMPSYIQYMDTIQKLEKQGIKVKISDISDAMNLPRPGVTRTVKEMEAKGYLHKFASKEDGRVTYISITEEGKKLSRKYDQDYFSELALSLSDISEEEKNILENYFDNGGKLLVMAGPVESGDLPNLYSLLSDYGVKSDNGVVVDTDHDHYAFQAPYILMPTIESSDITDPLLDESYYAIVPIARGLEVGNTDKDVNVTSLLTTSDEAYSKAAGYNLTTYDKEDGDTDGPFALGVDITQDENDGQMIWYASSYLVDDTYNSYSSGANLDLVMNSISSLVGRRDAVSIRSKSLQYNYLTISDSTSSILKLVMIGVFPIVYLAVGIAIVVKRRRANEAN